MSNKRIILEYLIRHYPGEVHGWQIQNLRPGWTYIQRIYDLRQALIDINSRNVKGSSTDWLFRLVTPPDFIDVEHCCLRAIVEENGQLRLKYL